MLDTTVTVAHFNTEANSIYETLFSGWLPASKDPPVRLQVLEALVVRHAYPSRRLGGALTAMIFLSYVLWLNTIQLLGSFWVYPFLEVLTARVATNV